jgi:hypothetical protein
MEKSPRGVVQYKKPSEVCIKYTYTQDPLTILLQRRTRLKDLSSLCEYTLIPKAYHNFYRSLTSNDNFLEHSHNVRDDASDELESD